MPNILTYNPKLKELARKLRTNSTLGEILLWNQLKKNQLDYDFHRQKPIGNYIVDFYCPVLGLIIEVDGSTHDFKIEKDEARQREIEKLKLQFLRFTETDVRKNLDGVLFTIKSWIKEWEQTHPVTT